MKNYLLLSLFILSFASTYTMERSLSSLSSCNSFFSGRSSMKQTSRESQLILDLRKNKDNFENQLKLDKWIETKKTYISPNLQLFSLGSLGPIQFLQYCYYQKFHKTEFTDLDVICVTASSLTEYHEVEIDGYSALGVAMIAKKRFIEERRIFIKELIKYGFKPTIKDIGLAELILYDEILAKEQKEKLKNKCIHLLHQDSSAFWSLLPQDVRRQIAHCFIRVLKKDLWILPGF